MRTEQEETEDGSRSFEFSCNTTRTHIVEYIKLHTVCLSFPYVCVFVSPVGYCFLEEFTRSESGIKKRRWTNKPRKSNSNICGLIYILISISVQESDVKGSHTCYIYHTCNEYAVARKSAVAPDTLSYGGILLFWFPTSDFDWKMGCRASYLSGGSGASPSVFPSSLPSPGPIVLLPPLW